MNNTSQPRYRGPYVALHVNNERYVRLVPARETERGWVPLTDEEVAAAIERQQLPYERHADLPAV